MQDAARLLQLVVNGSAAGCIYGLIAHLERRDDWRNPCGTDRAAEGGDPDDQRSGACGLCLTEIKVFKTEVDRTRWQPPLTDTPIPRPIDQPARRLGTEPVDRVSQKQEIFSRDDHFLRSFRERTATPLIDERLDSYKHNAKSQLV